MNKESGPILTMPYFHKRWNPDDIDELNELGANGVIFCIRESHLGGEQSIDSMKLSVDRANSLGMKTEADLWGGGRVFGGEANSEFDFNSPACYDEHGAGDEFNRMLRDYIRFADNLGVDGLFWDEPHFKDCPHCIAQSKSKLSNEYRLVHKYAEYDRRLYGLENSICFTSNDKNIELMGRLATKRYIQQIGTDPYYTNYPNHVDGPDNYVDRYAESVLISAGKMSKEAQIFVQGFDLREDWEDIPLRAAEAAIKKGIRRIGFWGCVNWERSEMDFGYPDIVPARNDLVIQNVPEIRSMLERASS